MTIEPILAKHNLIGDYNLDPNLNFVGLAADGGFAKYCVLDGDIVHVIPDGLSYEQAALTEPAAVAVYAVRQSALKTGDTAVIFGLGPIGLLIVEALRAAGASKIYAVELSPERQAKAEERAIVVRPEGENNHRTIHRLTGGGKMFLISDWSSSCLGQPLRLFIKSWGMYNSYLSWERKLASIQMNSLSKKISQRNYCLPSYFP